LSRSGRAGDRRVPLYTFDKHTAIGKAAIHRLARESQAVRDAPAAFGQEYSARDAAFMAASCRAPAFRRLEWDGSTALEALGVENDMLGSGAPLAGIQPILSVVREIIDHLNVIRARLFSATPRSGNPRLTSGAPSNP
jgi:hypothetical protein